MILIKFHGTADTSKNCFVTKIKLFYFAAIHLDHLQFTTFREQDSGNFSVTNKLIPRFLLTPVTLKFSEIFIKIESKVR